MEKNRTINYNIIINFGNVRFRLITTINLECFINFALIWIYLAKCTCSINIVLIGVPTSKLFLKSYKKKAVGIFWGLIDTSPNFVLSFSKHFYPEVKLTWVKVKNSTIVWAWEWLYRCSRLIHVLIDLLIIYKTSPRWSF